MPGAPEVIRNWLRSARGRISKTGRKRGRKGDGTGRQAEEGGLRVGAGGGGNVFVHCVKRDHVPEQLGSSLSAPASSWEPPEGPGTPLG